MVTQSRIHVYHKDDFVGYLPMMAESLTELQNAMIRAAYAGVAIRQALSDVASVGWSVVELRDTRRILLTGELRESVRVDSGKVKPSRRH